MGTFFRAHSLLAPCEEILPQCWGLALPTPARRYKETPGLHAPTALSHLQNEAKQTEAHTLPRDTPGPDAFQIQAPNTGTFPTHRGSPNLSPQGEEGIS